MVQFYVDIKYNPGFMVDMENVVETSNPDIVSIKYVVLESSKLINVTVVTKYVMRNPDAVKQYVIGILHALWWVHEIER
jgi:hypothetical protein